jgi:hypothetical protein
MGGEITVDFRVSQRLLYPQVGGPLLTGVFKSPCAVCPQLLKIVGALNSFGCGSFTAEIMDTRVALITRFRVHVVGVLGSVVAQLILLVYGAADVES